ncbi:MAG: thioredoxin domain-containing protein, partial [Bryocella sp.]
TVASAVKISRDEARTLVETAARKLYAARLLRKTPYIDKTIYVGWNAMCVSAYLEAGRVLEREDTVAFALKSLDRALTAFSDGALHRVIAYSEGTPAAPIAGVLEDYAFLANACLDAFEATGKLSYFTTAQQLADAMLARFYDATGGAFFDAERDPAAIGALTARRKPMQDSPTPSGNSIAVIVLLRLAALTDIDLYREKAEDTLESFAGIVEHYGLYASTYGLALRRAVSGITQVAIIGSDAHARELEAAALRGYAANRSVLHLPNLESLPPALASTLTNLPAQQGSYAVVCKDRSCFPPVTTVDALLTSLA